MYRPPLGVHVPPVQRRIARPRGTIPKGARPQLARPRGDGGGRARRGQGHPQYDFGPRDRGFVVHYDNGGSLTTIFAHYLNGAWSLWPKTFAGNVDQSITMLSPSDGWAAYLPNNSKQPAGTLERADAALRVPAARRAVDNDQILA
jgi:hypothetical protein